MWIARVQIVSARGTDMDDAVRKPICEVVGVKRVGRTFLTNRKIDAMAIWPKSAL